MRPLVPKIESQECIMKLVRDSSPVSASASRKYIHKVRSALSLSPPPSSYSLSTLLLSLLSCRYPLAAARDGGKGRTSLLFSSPPPLP